MLNRLIVASIVALALSAGLSAQFVILGRTIPQAQAGGVAPSCTYSIGPGAQTTGSDAYTGVVEVYTQSGCAWTATSNTGFLTVTSGASGTGPGYVGYAAAANTGSLRTGTLTAATSTFTVTQPAPIAAFPTEHFDSGGVITVPVVLTRGTTSATGLKLGSLTTQTDVKNSWDDGSVKLALVSAIIPSSGDYAVTAISNPGGSIMPTWPTASVRFQYRVANLATQAPNLNNGSGALFYQYAISYVSKGHESFVDYSRTINAQYLGANPLTVGSPNVLTWRATPGADSYKIYRRSDSQWPPTTAWQYLANPTAAGYTDDGSATPTSAAPKTDTTDDPGDLYMATLPTRTASDCWLSGAVVEECRVVVTPLRTSDSAAHAYLRVVFDIRCYSNGQCRVDATPENMFHSGGNTENYDVTFVVAGTTVYSRPFYKHYYLSRYRKTFPASGYSEAAIVPDFSTAQAAGFLNQLLPGINNASGFLTYPNQTTPAAWDVTSPFWAASCDIPYTCGDWDPYMPDYGERDGIGPVPDYAGSYIANRTAAVRKFLLTTDNLEGQWAMHVYDSSRRLIHMDRLPGAKGYWIDDAGGRVTADCVTLNDTCGPQGVYLTSNRLTQPELNHYTSVGVVSYLASGDRYYMEEAKYWGAGSLYLTTGPGTSSNWFVRTQSDMGSFHPLPELKNSSLHFLNPIQQVAVRGIAWSLRALADAANITPDSDLDQAYFIEATDNNLQRLDLEADIRGTVVGPTGRSMFEGLGDPTTGEFVGNQPWMNGMLLWSVDHAIGTNLYGTHGAHFREVSARYLTRDFNAEAEGMPRWFENSPVDQTGLWRHTGDYSDFGVQWLPTFGRVYERTMEGHPGNGGDGRRTIRYNGYHIIETWAQLSVAEGLGIPGATSALDYLQNGLDYDTQGAYAGLLARHGWAIARNVIGLKNHYVPAATKPTALIPAQTSVNVALTPTLSWNPVPSATNYTVRLGRNDADCAAPCYYFTPPVLATVAGTSYTISSPLLPNTAYFWRVDANLPASVIVKSDPLMLTTVCTAAPTWNAPYWANLPPGTLYPSHEALYNNYNPNGYAHDDPRVGPGIQDYIFQSFPITWFAECSNRWDLILEATNTSSPTTVVATNLTKPYYVPTYLPNTTYSARVKAYGPGGGPVLSQVFHFTTANF